MPQNTRDGSSQNLKIIVLNSAIGDGFAGVSLSQEGGREAGGWRVGRWVGGK